MGGIIIWGQFDIAYIICYIKLTPSFMDTPVIGKRLRDVITLESLNILYFCSKSSKKLDFISNVYDNIKFSSEGGCRLIQKEM